MRTKGKNFEKQKSGLVPSINDINRDKAKLLAALLYGCEGSKYPSHRGIAFANSEPGLVLAFTELLRKAYDLDPKKIRVHLQIHTNQDFGELRSYWSKLIGVSEGCFIKPTITSPMGGKHRLEYRGTCTFRYADYRIQLKLLGLYEAFIKRFLKGEGLV